jgi:hypothetical protein
VNAPLQAFVFSSYLLNVLLQLANKKWDSKQKKTKTKKIAVVRFFTGQLPSNDREIQMYRLMAGIYEVCRLN